MVARTYEIRDPVHGFAVLSEWERDIINHWVFQRLRRIKQLGWTDMVYPGAAHTRFEHSLGVAHVASQMFDRIASHRRQFLESELDYVQAGLDKDKVLVRLASLLHDVGHAPFSHATEELMPVDPTTGKPYKHEDYSAAAIAFLMRDVIEDSKGNQNYGIKAQDVADFVSGRVRVGRAILWRNLLSSQLDADRADYLLRDSLHIGVAYGRYDLSRLLYTMTVTEEPETGSPTLAVEDGGAHAAEGLILARYMMFTQVYFQHTRRSYDHLITRAMRTVLAEDQKRTRLEAKDRFPPPTSAKNVEAYLDWDDWRVLGLLKAGQAGEDGRLLLSRQHPRRVFQTPEVPLPADLRRLEEARARLGTLVAFVDTAEQSWYKFEKDDVPIVQFSEAGPGEYTLLSELSNVVHGLKAVKQTRIYVPYAQRREANDIVRRLGEGKDAR